MSQDTIALIIGLAGGTLAALAGFIAEPVRGAIKQWLEIKRLRRALYHELAYQYVRVDQFARRELSPTRDLLLLGKKAYGHFDGYEYAKANPIVLFGLKDAAGIRSAYALFEMFYSSDETDTLDGSVSFAGQVTTNIEEMLRINAIDRDAFMGALGKRFKVNMQGRIDRHQ